MRDKREVTGYGRLSFALTLPGCPDAGTRYFHTHARAEAYGRSTGFSWAVWDLRPSLLRDPQRATLSASGGVL
jgi:hypothetical protein